MYEQYRNTRWAVRLLFAGSLSLVTLTGLSRSVCAQTKTGSAHAVFKTVNQGLWDAGSPTALQGSNAFVASVNTDDTILDASQDIGYFHDFGWPIGRQGLDLGTYGARVTAAVKANSGLRLDCSSSIGSLSVTAPIDFTYSVTTTPGPIPGTWRTRYVCRWNYTANSSPNMSVTRKAIDYGIRSIINTDQDFGAHILGGKYGSSVDKDLGLKFNLDLPLVDTTLFGGKPFNSNTYFNTANTTVTYQPNPAESFMVAPNSAGQFASSSTVSLLSINSNLTQLMLSMLNSNSYQQTFGTYALHYLGNAPSSTPVQAFKNSIKASGPLASLISGYGTGFPFQFRAHPQFSTDAVFFDALWDNNIGDMNAALTVKASEAFNFSPLPKVSIDKATLIMPNPNTDYVFTILSNRQPSAPGNPVFSLDANQMTSTESVVASGQLNVMPFDLQAGLSTGIDFRYRISSLIGTIHFGPYKFSTSTDYQPVKKINMVASPVTIPIWSKTFTVQGFNSVTGGW